MRTQSNPPAMILMSYSADVSNWVQAFETQARAVGYDVLSANGLKRKPFEMMRAVRSSALVIAVIDPASAVNLSWIAFVVGAAFALRKKVWLVTPEPPLHDQEPNERFDELRRAIGAHLWGTPSEVVRRLVRPVSYEAKAS